MANRCIEISGEKNLVQKCQALTASTSGLAYGQPPAVIVTNHAGLDHFGRGKYHQSECPLRSQELALSPVGIDAADYHPSASRRSEVEEPVGQPVAGRHYGRAGSEEGQHRIDRPGDLVGLECHDYEVLDPELRWHVGAPHIDHLLLAPGPEAKSVFLHCSKMRPASHQADIKPRPPELSAEISANGAGAKDAYFRAYPHAVCPGLNDRDALPCMPGPRGEASAITRTIWVLTLSGIRNTLRNKLRQTAGQTNRLRTRASVPRGQSGCGLEASVPMDEGEATPFCPARSLDRPLWTSAMQCTCELTGLGTCPRVEGRKRDQQGHSQGKSAGRSELIPQLALSDARARYWRKSWRRR